MLTGRDGVFRVVEYLLAASRQFSRRQIPEDGPVLFRQVILRMLALIIELLYEGVCLIDRCCRRGQSSAIVQQPSDEV